MFVVPSNFVPNEIYIISRLLIEAIAVDDNSAR